MWGSIIYKWEMGIRFFYLFSFNFLRKTWKIKIKGNKTWIQGKKYIFIHFWKRFFYKSMKYSSNQNNCMKDVTLCILYFLYFSFLDLIVFWKFTNHFCVFIKWALCFLFTMHNPVCDMTKFLYYLIVCLKLTVLNTFNLKNILNT